jgi:hypothetical protein
MMRSILAGLCLLVAAPVAVHAQVEVGVDGGLVFNTGFETSDNVTQISIPTGRARVGFPMGELLTLETLLGFQRVSLGGESGSALNLLPGMNVRLGDGGGYLRGEVAVARASFGGESETQWGFGGAVGVRMQVDDAVFFRLEGGFDRWLEDQDSFQEAYNEIRITVGVSAIVGG